MISSMGAIATGEFLKVGGYFIVSILITPHFWGSSENREPGRLCNTVACMAASTIQCAPSHVYDKFYLPLEPTKPLKGGWGSLFQRWCTIQYTVCISFEQG